LRDNEKNTQQLKVNRFCFSLSFVHFFFFLKENETIIDEWKSGHSNNLIELKNKTPTYNEGYSIKTKFIRKKNFFLI